MGTQGTKREARLKRKQRIRKNLSGTTERPRLSVFRSLKQIYAQIIDDTTGNTLVAVASTEKEVKENIDQKDKTEVAKYIGSLIAQRAAAKGIEQVVFDRNGFLYHGRVKAVSVGAREGGLVF
ncbi:MAG: 50S ribosomal protein L18 [Deltaproteobacteria bacterium]|nr:50S ribosomal protein L18 [Deltaproteobacteria bacterium]